MATITVKTYRCDVCGEKVAGASNLRRFYIEWGKPQRYDTKRPGISLELCKERCVEKFADTLLPFIDQQGRNAILPPAETEEEH